MSTHKIPFFNIKMKITLNYLKSAANGFFPRAISFRATEALLYLLFDCAFELHYNKSYNAS